MAFRYSNHLSPTDVASIVEQILQWQVDDFTPTNRQTVFTLSSLPHDSAEVSFYINGVWYRGNDPNGNPYINISGQTVTWLFTAQDPVTAVVGGFDIYPTDTVKIQYLTEIA